MATLKLSDIPVHGKCKVIKVTGEKAIRKRLLEMGFVKGTDVYVSKQAPLGDPMELVLKGYHISLRRQEAGDVNVEAPEIEAILDRKRLKVALCGNPNAGKTSLFNALTGSRQHVGNWAGVTVEKKEGYTTFGKYDIEVVDLPGTYSLTAFSMEELIARDYIIHESPDVVINVVDSTNLERNLFLTTQLIELGCKAVVALNMADEAKHKGILIDTKKLSELLGMPVVQTVGSVGTGVRDVLREAVAIKEAQEPLWRHIHINYGAEVEEEIKKIQVELRKDPLLSNLYSTRWFAVKLLEHDKQVTAQIMLKSKDNENILRQVDISHAHIEKMLNDESEIILADARYGFIKGVLGEAYSHRSIDRVTLSDHIDKVLTNRIVGIPILIGLLWVMFQTTFNLGNYPMNWINSLVGQISAYCSAVMPNGILKDLLINGIISGAGGVIVYLPNIMILFLFISFFEDTGYMARAAFIMDRVMHTLGLHGKSFIPMIMGFGCNTTAIISTRTLENKTDRMLSILINPLISCSARLPVYILLAGTFFGKNAGSVIFGIYLTGIMLAILMGQLFRKTLFKGETAPFVMELPPYRLPTIQSVLIHMWEKGSIFLRKVGGLILVASIIIWFVTAFPKPTAIPGSPATEDVMSQSYAGRAGKFIEPVLKPLGFGWKGGVALLTGVAAKEIVISTFGVLYHAGDKVNEESEGLRNALKQDMTPLSALSFMLFTLIYIPCIGALGVMWRELGAVKWTLFAVGYSLTLAWVISFVVYQGGSFLGFK
ncbi:MAG: ferrous iron transport protein B [Candidatus Omnitrophica bacterium]|nr:ferrous iron transport protein B [Candidatus Omnitrophota bacterium]